jgi:GAF domain-containing protein
MSLSGSLRDASIGDVLQFIYIGGRSGTLSVTRGKERAEVGFHRGHIVSAWGPGSKRLGELLLEEGAISESKLAGALAQQSRTDPRPSLGQVLIENGDITREVLERVIEGRINQVVGDLLTWRFGNFEFASEDPPNIDDFAVSPASFVPLVHVDTQLLLVGAVQAFDERNRSRGGAPAPAAQAPASARKASGVGIPQAFMTGALTGDDDGWPAVKEAAPRLQVVSADEQLVAALRQRLEGVANVVTVGLREAGSPPPGEMPPVVLVDGRAGGVKLDAIDAVRRSHPRAPVLAVIGSEISPEAAYEMGALAALPPHVDTVVACFRSVARSRRDSSTEGAIAEGVRAGFSKLRRFLWDLRSGLMSATISLNLMNIISESVERAVLFLARQEDLLALGAFGPSADGRPLAQRTRGLRLRLDEPSVLVDTLNDGRTRSARFEPKALPVAFAELLGRPRSGQFAVFPVLGRQRVLALIYADNGQQNRVIEEMEILELAAEHLGVAFENEVLRRQVIPQSG